MPSSLAPFDVTIDRSIDGPIAGPRRIAIDTVSTTTTVGDLARRIARGRPILIDGRDVPDGQRLTGSMIRHGSRIGAGSATAGFGSATNGVAGPAVLVEVAWTCGPDAGAVCSLAAGAHLVGRSRRASVGCADPAIELHHAVLDVDAEGTVWLTQLAGVCAVLVDGAPVDGRVRVCGGQRVSIGASMLVLREPATASVDEGNGAPVRFAGHRLDPWRVRHVRSPRPLMSFTPQPLDAPRRRQPPAMFGGALLPTIVGLLGSVVLAVLFDQLMFLMFGALGAFVAFGTWAAQKIGVTRSRRGAQRADEGAAAAFAAALAGQRVLAESAHRGSVPTIDKALKAMHARSATLWGTRSGDPDAFCVSIGEGDVVWQPNVVGLDRDTTGETWGAIDRSSRLQHMPLPASLAAGTVTALTGGGDTVAVVRSMVLQLAATSGPADWRLAVITDRPELWSGLTWLAHIVDEGGAIRIADADGSAELISRLDDHDTRHLVVVVDQPVLLGARTTPLRRALAGGRSVAAIVVCSDETTVPAVATSALTIGRLCAGRWIADTRATALAEVVHVAGVSNERAHDAAAAMACLIDPEVAGDSATLPSQVGLADLLADVIGVDSGAHASRISGWWSAAGSDPAPVTPIGVAADGVVEIDLVRDGPHALFAGTTGAGKSELLRSLVVGLAARLSPDHITFVLVDYKGGSTFDACADLPHVVGVVTDLDDRLAARALRSLEAELRRREQLLRDAGVSDLSDYRRSNGADDRDGERQRPMLPRLVVVIDEFASLAVQQPDFIGALLGIAQRGRSLGVHLVLAT
ncbi:MAG: FtsK/SpoIIIE domain-containing protein, partial [Ilumatobacteraceae bacterium]